MKFRPTPTNLEITITDSDAEAVARAAMAILIPRYCRKLYFLADGSREYPELELLSKQRFGFTIVREGSEPSNLAANFRIVHRDREMFIAAGPQAGLTKDDWREIASELATHC